MKKMSKIFIFYAFIIVFLSSSSFAAINLEFLSTVELEGGFDDGAAGISAYYPISERLFTINGSTSSIDIIDPSDPAIPTVIDSIDLSEFSDGFTSVDVGVHGVAAASLEPDDTVNPVTIVLWIRNGNSICSGRKLSDLLS